MVDTYGKSQRFFHFGDNELIEVDNFNEIPSGAVPIMVSAQYFNQLEEVLDGSNMEEFVLHLMGQVRAGVFAKAIGSLCDDVVVAKDTYLQTR